MSAALATLALVALVWGAASVASSLVVGLVWARGRSRRLRADPTSRARAAALAALVPSAAPTLLVALCLAPGVLNLAGLPLDHCTQHPDHPHLCLVHPSAALTPALAGWLGLAVALGGLALLRLGAALVRDARHRRALGQGSGRMLRPGVHEIDSDRPFSFTAGLARPAVWLSSALTRSLTGPQLDVVVAHERAHVRRRDPARAFVCRALSFPLWPSLRHEVLAELALASERACDEAAGVAVSDRLLVAETILAVERLLAGEPATTGPVLAGFAGRAVGERVHGLLAETVPARPHRAGWWTFGLAVAMGAAAEPLHHGIEHLIETLLAR